MFYKFLSSYTLFCAYSSVFGTHRKKGCFPNVLRVSTFSKQNKHDMNVWLCSSTCSKIGFSQLSTKLDLCVPMSVLLPICPSLGTSVARFSPQNIYQSNKIKRGRSSRNIWDTCLTFWTHPAKEPLSLRLIGSVWMLCTPPRYKLCGNERCQNPFGETVITSGSWSICNAETE